MTREEQIAIASCAYGSRGSSIDFTVGAKWADSHPKSPWIRVDEDLPCNHKELMASESMTVNVFVASKDGRFSSDFMIEGSNKYYWDGDLTPDYWMFPPKLPKE